jgi:hypothetical protein
MDLFRLTNNESSAINGIHITLLRLTKLAVLRQLQALKEQHEHLWSIVTQMCFGAYCPESKRNRATTGVGALAPQNQ